MARTVASLLRGRSIAKVPNVLGLLAALDDDHASCTVLWNAQMRRSLSAALAAECETLDERRRAAGSVAVVWDASSFAVAYPSLARRVTVAGYVLSALVGALSRCEGSVRNWPRTFVLAFQQSVFARCVAERRRPSAQSLCVRVLALLHELHAPGPQLDPDGVQARWAVADRASIVPYLLGLLKDAAQGACLAREEALRRGSRGALASAHRAQATELRLLRDEILRLLSALLGTTERRSDGDPHGATERRNDPKRQETTRVATRALVDARAVDDALFCVLAYAVQEDLRRDVPSRSWSWSPSTPRSALLSTIQRHARRDAVDADAADAGGADADAGRAASALLAREAEARSRAAGWDRGEPHASPRARAGTPCSSSPPSNPPRRACGSRSCSGSPTAPASFRSSRCSSTATAASSSEPCASCGRLCAPTRSCAAGWGFWASFRCSSPRSACRGASASTRAACSTSTTWSRTKRATARTGTAWTGTAWTGTARARRGGSRRVASTARACTTSTRRRATTGGATFATTFPRRSCCGSVRRGPRRLRLCSTGRMRPETPRRTRVRREGGRGPGRDGGPGRARRLRARRPHALDDRHEESPGRGDRG